MSSADQSRRKIKSGSLFVAGVISLFTAVFVLLAGFVYYAWKKQHAQKQNQGKPAYHQKY